MQVAIFGLGRMGMQIAKRLKQNNFDVLAWNRSEQPRQEFIDFGGRAYASESDLVANMTDSPRIFWIMLPSGVVEDFLFGAQGLAPHLKAGDIVIDGGNSFFRDSQRRAKTLAEKGIFMFDCGTSGGVWGLSRGFALMVGGSKDKWQNVELIFKTLSSGNNYGLVGQSGAGHFVKMVHNGIEYGMMEAIAEGYAVMQASEFNPDLKKVTEIYQTGSVVASWLIDLMHNIYEHPEMIERTSGRVDATGEGEWTVNEAKRLGIDARVIADSLEVRKESQADTEAQKKYSNKILALLRQQFGGHAITKE